MATGVAVPSRQEAHDQASALTTHGELGWFYHVKTLGAVKAWPWGSLACQDFARSPVFSFAGGSHPPGYGSGGKNDFEFARKCIVQELKAQVRTGTLVPLVADLVVKDAEGVAAGSTLAPPKPSASRQWRQKSKASKPAQQKPKASGPEQQKPKASEPEQQKPIASEPEQQKPKAPEQEQQKPAASKGSGLLSRLRGLFWRGRR